jgi:hypothetical protein
MSMKHGKRHSIVAGCVALVAMFGMSSAQAVEKASVAKRIVYIEASTGRAWKLEQFPERENVRDVSFQFIPVYDFDKSTVVAKTLEFGARRPDAVVLQECSAYFPGPLDEYKKMYRGWIQQVKQAGVTPVIATTVPPAERSGLAANTKEFIKTRILRRTSQYDQIAEFNDWLHGLAKEEGIRLLDLEEFLRRGPNDRTLKGEYDLGDGTHLNDTAYQLLDRKLAAFLKEMK